MQLELCDLNTDIELKTKLIEQLELSQQRMQVMRQHYEEKLNVLNVRIIDTQKERDKVLCNMGSSIGIGGQSNDKIKKVREEYEKKLSEMTKSLRKLQTAQKEHLRQQREIQSQDAQLKTLRSTLLELKSNKIKLVRKMNDESNRHKEEDTKKSREIAQLKKESRKQLNKIKSLEAQGTAKDQVLKRRTDQISALKKVQKSSLSTKAAGRVTPKVSLMYNPRQARQKWDTINRTIGRAARSKQAVVQLERELERLLEERESLSRDLVSVSIFILPPIKIQKNNFLLQIKKRQKLSSSPDLFSEEDSIRANLNYIQENISQIQNSIMELEEGKESADEIAALNNILEQVRTVDEAKYLIERLFGTTISLTCEEALSSTRLKERETLLQEVQQDSSMQQQLLQHVLAQTPTSAFTDILQTSDMLRSNYSDISVRSNETVVLRRDIDELNSMSPVTSRSPSPAHLE